MTDPENLSETGPSARLVGKTDRVGVLLREASETEFRVPPGEFARLVARRDERARRSRAIQGVAVSAPALAVVFALWWRNSHEPSLSAIAPEVAKSGPSILRLPSSAERTLDLSTARVSESAVREAVPVSEAPVVAALSKAKNGVHPVSVAANSARRVRTGVEASRTSQPEVGGEVPVGGAAPAFALGQDASAAAVRLAPPAPVAQLETTAPSGELPPRPALPASRAQDCQELLRAERYSEASECQAARAEQSTGTAAELALLNQARIETKALGRPELALQTLAAYRRRFPHGVLMREAEIAEKQAKSAANGQVNRH